MSLWLRALAILSPEAAIKRANALALLSGRRNYDGARGGFRAESLTGKKGTANAMISRSLSDLTARAHDLVRNTPEAARAVEIFASHAVGSGITVKWDTGRDADDRRVSALFQQWSESADVEGVLDFAGLQKLAVMSMFEGGDCLLRMVDRPLSSGFNQPVPLKLQLIEGERIDSSRDAVTLDRIVRLGVEVDDWGRRLAYFVVRDPDRVLSSGVLGDVMRLDARDTCHLYRPLRPGQIRGVTSFAPIMLAQRDQADLIEALTMKARTEALFSVAVESAEGNGVNLAGETNDKDHLGRKIEEMTPGMVHTLSPGDKIHTISPTGTLESEPLMIANWMRIAAGLGLTYDQLTGDLRQANYSSLRAGKIEFRRMIEQFQWLNLVPMVMRRVTRRFVERAVLSGALPARNHDWPCDFVMPSNEPIDPRKDLEADILAVRAGRMSPQEFIGGWGRDWRAVIKEHQEFAKLMDETGLVLDIDPRQTTQTGASQGAARAEQTAAA